MINHLKKMTSSQRLAIIALILLCVGMFSQIIFNIGVFVFFGSYCARNSEIEEKENNRKGTSDENSRSKIN